MHESTDIVMPKQVYVDLNVQARLRSIGNVWLRMGLPGLAAIVWSFFIGFQPVMAGALFTVGLLCILFAASTRSLMRSRSLQWTKEPQNAAFFLPYRVLFDDRHLEVARVEGTSTSMPWSAVQRRVSDAESIVLYLAGDRFLWIPRGSLTDTAQELLERSCPAPTT